MQTPKSPISMLVVDSDSALLQKTRAAAGERGYEVSYATSSGNMSSIDVAGFDVLLVRIGRDAQAGIAAIRHIKDRAPDAEVIVMSESAALAASGHSHNLNELALLEQEFDVEQLFAAVDRAVERRRLNRQNQRLMWELQTVNEIAE